MWSYTHYLAFIALIVTKNEQYFPHPEIYCREINNFDISYFMRVLKCSIKLEILITI